MKYLVKGKKRVGGEDCYPHCPGYYDCTHYEGCVNLLYCPFPDGPKTLPKRKRK